jgi:hypothetical protein
MLNLAGTQALCADIHPLCTAVDLNGHLLYIRVPDSIGSSMRMADVVAEMSAFSTDFTLGHDYTSSRFKIWYTTLIILSEEPVHCKQICI